MADLFKRLSLRPKKAKETAPKAQSPKEGDNQPPPPKPGTNSIKIDNTLTKKKIGGELSEEQMATFKRLMGKNEFPFEQSMVNLGVALGIFDDYSKKGSMEETMQKFNWVFLTENPLGEQLRGLFNGLQEQKIIESDKGATFRVVTA